MKPNLFALSFFLLLGFAGTRSVSADSGASDPSREITVAVTVTDATKGIVVNFNDVPPTVNAEDSVEVRHVVPPSLDTDFFEASRPLPPSPSQS